MHVAQISTLSAPVREHSQGSVESLIWLLSRELVRMGHQVTIFASADSDVPAGARLEATQPGPYAVNGAIDDWHICEWLNIARAVERAREFDVLHSHAYLWSLPLSRISQRPLVHSTHIVPDDNTAKLWALYPEAHVIAVSRRQFDAYAALKPAAVVDHGVDTAHFSFNGNPSDYVVYVGRFVAGKGPRQAIAAARTAGVRLVMAGPANDYFREFIKPKVDGKTVEYAGFVRGAARDKLLREARALVYPIQFAESFGLVLVEAMLCGTPVAAMRLGAVPEIVEEGITGFMVDDTEQLPSALQRCFSLDRRVIRERAIARFSAERMAREYADFYARVAGVSR